MNSVATAKLGIQLAYIAWGFSGGKGAKPKLKPEDFFPFPDWKPLSKKETLGPSPITKMTLARLFKQRRIPPHVYTQLMASPEDD